MTTETKTENWLGRRLDAAINLALYGNTVEHRPHTTYVPYTKIVYQHHADEAVTFTSKRPAPGVKPDQVTVRINNPRAGQAPAQLDQWRRDITVTGISAECVRDVASGEVDRYEFTAAQQPVAAAHAKQRVDYALDELTYWLNYDTPVLRGGVGNRHEFTYRTWENSEAGALCDTIRAQKVPVKDATQSPAR